LQKAISAAASRQTNIGTSIAGFTISLALAEQPNSAAAAPAGPSCFWQANSVATVRCSVWFAALPAKLAHGARRSSVMLYLNLHALRQSAWGGLPCGELLSRLPNVRIAATQPLRDQSPHQSGVKQFR
jgi:hypothetical protein